MNNAQSHETILQEDATFGLGEIRVLHPPDTFAITPASLISIQAIGNHKHLLRGSMNEEQWSQMAPFGREIDQCLRQTWKSVMAIELADAIWESNIVGFMKRPDFHELPTAEKLANLHDDPDGLVVRVELKATIGDLCCQLALCYPAASLETLLPHMG